MDYFEICTRKAAELRNEIVNDIRIVLEERGYDSAFEKVSCNGKVIELEPDRVIVNGYHTDNLAIDDLLNTLHACYHVFYK